VSGPDHDFANMVGELALKLHMNQSDSLSSDLPAESLKPSYEEATDYRIEGKTVRFSSIEARNRCVAVHVHNKNRQAFATDTQMWLSATHDLWRCEIGEADSAAGRLLAIVHTMDDIFAIAASAVESKSIRVFDALQVVEAALSYISDIPVDSLLKLCSAQYERTKNDLAAGIFFNKLEKQLIGYPTICRTIHERLRHNTDETTINLHSVALLALAKSSPADAVRLALEDAQSSDVILISSALWTLGRLLTLPIAKVDAIPAVTATIIMNMSATDEKVRQTAINTAAHAAPIISAFDEPLTKRAQAGDQYALAAIAYTLMLSFKEMKGKAHFKEWVRLLCKLSPQTKGGIDNFDNILYQMISDESQQQFVISCITDWVCANAENTPRDKSLIDLFDSTVSELAKRPELLSQTITEWFLSDGVRLASAAAGLLSYLWVHGIKKPEFSRSRLDVLEPSDLLFLARRMLGFVSSEDHLISLTMSLLNTKNAPQRIFGIARSLLIDELGQDYPTSIVDAMEAAKSSATESDWITFYSSIIENINGQMKMLEALPRLTELRPPPSLQRQFIKARNKQMSKSVEEASKGSLIQQLATKIPIKAGLGCFSFYDGSYSSPSYLKSFSHSVSLPRRYALDEVGYEISRLFMRLAKRGEA